MGEKQFERPIVTLFNNFTFHQEGGWVLEHAAQESGHSTKPERVQEVSGPYSYEHSVILGTMLLCTWCYSWGCPGRTGIRFW